MTDLMEAPTAKTAHPHLVWTEVTPFETRETAWGRNPRSWTEATSVSVWRNEERDSVSCSWSEHIMGINNHSGKKYSRWQTTKLINVRRNHKGNIIVIGWEKNRGKKHWFSVYQCFDHISAAPAEFRQEIYERFGIRDIQSIFPLAAPRNRYTAPHVIPKKLMPYYRGTVTIRKDGSRSFAPDIQKLTKKLYGPENYRKDLVKSVASSHSGWHILMQSFVGIVPIDWVVTALKDRRAVTPDWPEGTPAGLTDLLRLLDRNTLRRLMNADDTGYIPDVVRMWIYTFRARVAEGLREFRITDWHSLHEAMVAIRNNRTPAQIEAERKAALERKAKHSKLATSLDCLEVNGQVLLLAENGADLLEWGSEFRNCISGYQGALENGSAILAAIFDTNREDKMIVNLEIRDGRLIQFLGKANSHLPDEVKTPWLEALKAKGVDVPESGWGF